MPLHQKTAVQLAEATFAPEMPIMFTVYGTPKPQGSMRAFYKAGMKRAVITSDNKKLKPWRQEITATAMALGVPILDGPIAIELEFYLARPKSAKKRVYPTVKPDIDKLARGCLDAITGVLIRDDAQVVSLVTLKHYGDVERVEIRLEAL